MTRNAPLKDNAPVMVGLMAACPDGNGFEARFENFSVKHLPDQRRLEWLKSHQQGLRKVCRNQKNTGELVNNVF